MPEQTLSEKSAVYKALRPFAFGGTAGSCATCIMQPVDMVMKRSQIIRSLDATAKTDMISVTRSILAQEGFMFMYTGLSAAIFRQLTYGLSRLGIFRTLTDTFGPKDGSPTPFATRLPCSMLAGGLGAVIGTPPDAALVRLQADTMLPLDQRRNYKGAIDALTRMYREEGMNGFFSGCGPTVCRGLAMNVGMLCSYDTYKVWLGEYLDGDSQSNRFASGFLSGWTAATMALPFDFVKSRLQAQKPNAQGLLPYAGFRDCAIKVLKSEGPFAFYAGYPTFICRICPHIMLTWVFLDALRDVTCLK